MCLVRGLAISQSELSSVLSWLSSEQDDDEDVCVKDKSFGLRLHVSAAPAVKLKLTLFTMRLGACTSPPEEDEFLVEGSDRKAEGKELPPSPISLAVRRTDGDRCDMAGRDNIMGVLPDNGDGLGRRWLLLLLFWFSAASAAAEASPDAEPTDSEHTDEPQSFSTDERQPVDESPADERLAADDIRRMPIAMLVEAPSPRRLRVHVTPWTECAWEQMVESSSHPSSRTMMLESRWADDIIIDCVFVLHVQNERVCVPNGDV